MNMKRVSTLFVAAFVSIASMASGENRPGPGPIVIGSGDYDFSGASLLTNTALQTEINTKLIQGAGCRSMSSIGYGNGYQCPAAGMTACMAMLKEKKVDACAQIGTRSGSSAPSTCTADDTAAAGKVSPAPASTCADLTVNLWNTMAINIPFEYAMKRLKAFGCTNPTGTTVTCPAHIYDWLCMPFQRGTVLTCTPPKYTAPPKPVIQ
jgi:hypothetical protein